VGFGRLALGRNVSVGVVFPGQGSQKVGMCADVVRAFPAARALVDRANAALGYDLFAIMESGPDETLRETRYSQPAIFVANMMLHAAAADRLDVAVSAGHSFGEYCSLTIAGALTFEAALGLVNERGLAMQRAADAAPGAMTAVLGLDDDVLRAIANAAREETGGRITLANFNAPGQIVISGDVEVVALVAERARSAGARKTVTLNVSGAWHSELMEPARTAFEPYVRDADIAMPRFPVISNVDAQPYGSIATIRQNLVTSVTAEVRWYETAVRLVAEPIDGVVEFGANAVLAPLFRRVPGSPRAGHAGDVAAIERLRDSPIGARA